MFILQRQRGVAFLNSQARALRHRIRALRLPQPARRVRNVPIPSRSWSSQGSLPACLPAFFKPKQQLESESETETFWETPIRRTTGRVCNDALFNPHHLGHLQGITASRADTLKMKNSSPSKSQKTDRQTVTTDQCALTTTTSCR